MRSEELLKELVRRYDILIGASGLLRVGQEHIEAINDLIERNERQSNLIDELKQELDTEKKCRAAVNAVNQDIVEALDCPSWADVVQWAKARKIDSDRWYQQEQRRLDPAHLDALKALQDTRRALGQLYHKSDTVAANVSRVIQSFRDQIDETDRLREERDTASRQVTEGLLKNRRLQQTIEHLEEERDTLRMENQSLRQQIVKWWAPARVDNTLNTYRCRFRTKGWQKDDVVTAFDRAPSTHYRVPIPWGGATDFRLRWGELVQTADGPALVYEAW